MGASQFEDLLAWQKARELNKEIYRITGSKVFDQDKSLRSQIRRASISVMSNIAEGFERLNPREFHHFLVIAKSSCGEVRSQLYAALDANYLSEAEFASLKRLATDTGRIVNGLRASVAKQIKT
jgi:four helix bundle protein